jgi:hypothetical protein
MRYEDLPLVGQGGNLQMHRYYAIIGPHSWTNRLNIGSGENEILVVRKVYLCLRRVTRPTTFNEAHLLCFLQDSSARYDIALLTLLTDEWPAWRSHSQDLEFPLVHGLNIYVNTADYSTGGTVMYDANILIERFVV